MKSFMSRQVRGGVRRRLRNVLISGCIIVAMMGCAKKTLLGMTLKETFSDSQVVSMVRAAEDDNIARVRSLIKLGADVNAVGKKHLSPLIWVLSNHNNAAVEVLLKAGANPNYKMPDGYSAVFLAAGGDNPEALKLVLKYGGDPNIIGHRGLSALQVAIAQFRAKNIETLLKHGVNVNWHDAYGASAATEAAVVGTFSQIANLLNNGYSYDLKALARMIEIRRVPQQSGQCHWKLKVLNMLKNRGVALPASAKRPGLTPELCVPSYYPPSWRR